MNYLDAKTIRDEREANVKSLGAKLNTYPKGDFGLTPDDVKFSEPYKTDKSNFDAAFKALQDFNKFFVKTFKKERLADRKAWLASGEADK